jgi:DMSO/TMAO reductase YedYZ molybdopterin-dependent catalytic subunit
VTPRGTDWSLAALVALLAVTGGLTALAGSPGAGWVFAAHGAGGFALAGVLAFKTRRVWRRLTNPRRWTGRARAGVLAAALVAATLASGWAWSSGATLRGGGYNLLNLHVVLGVALALGVLGHALIRARRPRRADVTDRRQFLTAAAVAGASLLAWQVQRPVQRALGMRGAHRRFTGSYPAESFPETSWVADRPRPLDLAAYRLSVTGAVGSPLELTAAELDAGDLLTATLDCTGGFYVTPEWRGVSLAKLLDRVGATGDHVRVISHTGYRWSFSADAARGFLLATHADGEPLSHGHGAPARLVAPGRRGFQWIKWVTRIELHDGPDPGAPASTVWSSFTPEGRGAA